MKVFKRCVYLITRNLLVTTRNTESYTISLLNVPLNKLNLYKISHNQRNGTRKTCEDSVAPPCLAPSSGPSPVVITDYRPAPS